MATDLKTQIKSIKKDIKALDAKVTKLLKQVDSPQKKKKAPAKKKTSSKTVIKKTSKKKANGGKTAYATFLEIVGACKDGITTAELMEKTGFDNKKIANLLFKAKKKGQIKTQKRGTYVKA